MSRHVMLNGEIMPSDKPCLMYNNRGLLWGDSFSIRLRGNSCYVYDFTNNFLCIISSIELLEMEKDDNFKSKILANDISLLLKKNRIYKEFVATITIFRNSNNTEKLSNDNTFSTLISVEAITPEFYQLNKDGIFTEYFQQQNISIDDANQQFAMELLCRKTLDENKLDDLIVCDEHGNIKRSLYSDIFFLNDNTLIVATKQERLSSNSTFSSRLIKLAESKLQMNIVKKEINKSDIKNMEAMFLADPINGIRWVVGLERKRFYQGKVEKIAYEIYNYYKTEVGKLKGEI